MNSIASLPIYDNLQALVMVFDMNDLSSFTALKELVSRTDLQKFDILLCIGNKVDLLPGHPAHVDYRRRLLKRNESSGSTPEFSQYGISENEGSSLLGDEESSVDLRKYCLEWCIDQNIEFVESCASNFEFDKCLSIDGDSQGVDRLHGALTAHMWPGMVLNSGDKIKEPSLLEQEDLSEEESDYELEYERLSDGSAEPVDDTFGGWVSFDDATASGSGESNRQELEIKDFDGNSQTRSVDDELQPSTSASQLLDEIHKDTMPKGLEIDRTSDADEGKAFDFEDLEQLMSEIGNMRNNLRLMPDFQRRDMAANLAMKMAAMFGDESEDEGGVD
ncbi:hypothetical protein Leryth_006385 [Lithospermum erythrorhizon]|nr:hypothetical protein Leryth_006385 [Lithospermum erythrorhizon]